MEIIPSSTGVKSAVKRPYIASLLKSSPNNASNVSFLLSWFNFSSLKILWKPVFPLKFILLEEPFKPVSEENNNFWLSL